MKHATLILAALLLMLGAGQAPAVSILYENGSLNNGTASTSPSISAQAVTDSFTLSNDSTLTSVLVGLWLSSGDSPGNVLWSIGTTAFASDEGSGTASFTSISDGNNLYTSTFSLISPLNLAAGTYWLTLQAATTTPTGGDVDWDLNSGPSTAYISSRDVPESIPSEYFQILGPAAVPEPASLTMLGIGIAFLVGYRWRRRRQTGDV
jgi:hypothetical protein